MSLSRSQISRQLVFLLQATNVLGAQSSAFEAARHVENYLASGLTFPIAAVQTFESPTDREAPGRLGPARFVISLAGQKVTEALAANYVASGGSSSSQKKLEGVIRGLLAGMNATEVGFFLASVHGFQGKIDKVSRERLVVAQGTSFSVAELEILATDATMADQFASPMSFKATPGGSPGSHPITLSWTNPAQTFDAYQNCVMRGIAPGDPAPGDINTGGRIFLGSPTATSVVDSNPNASGQTFNYALFRLYTKATPGDVITPRLLASGTTP